jgi:alpha-tubulin suppressor-like RCC1 family protein
MVSAGYAHTCALTVDGGVKCWGNNNSGQLGDGTTSGRFIPLDVLELWTGIGTIDAGGWHSCAVTKGGVGKCWGVNFSGQLGDGTTMSRSIPSDVAGLSNGVASISAAVEHTCALTSSGGVKCWGYNWYGQLGDGTGNSSTTPVDVVGLSNGTVVISSGQYHTCALTTGGGIKCWGSNTFGQLGDGTGSHTNNFQPTPVEVIGLGSGVVAISSGMWHTCAVTTAGGVKCWGNNDRSQLGDGTTTLRTAPVDVVGLSSGVAAVSAGEYHTCALTKRGGVKCWGDNLFGQLGDGTKNGSSTPVDVLELSSGVSAISAGYSHTCALPLGGGVRCWGRNDFGQLGINPGWTPVDVVGLEGTAYTQSRYFPYVSVR